MSLNAFPACMCEHHVCLLPIRERYSNPWNWSHRAVSNCVGPGTEPGSSARTRPLTADAQPQY